MTAELARVLPLCCRGRDQSPNFTGSKTSWTVLSPQQCDQLTHCTPVSNLCHTCGVRQWEFEVFGVFDSISVFAEVLFEGAPPVSGLYSTSGS